MKDKTFTLIQKRFLMGCMAIIMVMPLSAQALVTTYLNKAIVAAEKAILVSNASAADKADFSASIATAIVLKKNVTATQADIDAGINALNMAFDGFVGPGMTDSYDTLTYISKTWVAGSDFSGKYVIQNKKAHGSVFMSDNNGIAVATPQADAEILGDPAMYAWDIIMNADGTSYSLKCGGATATYDNGWHCSAVASFDSTVKPAVLYANWKITLADSNRIYIGKSDGTHFLKTEINPKAPAVDGVWRYYPDGGLDIAEPFKLIPCASTSSKDMLTSAITNAQAVLTAGSAKAADAKATLAAVIADATTVKGSSTDNFVLSAKIDALAVAVTDFDGMPTGVKESFASAVSVSPNPATDVIKVSNASSLSSVVIYSAIGQKVYDKAVTANEVNVSVSDWKSGVYVVTLISKNGAKKNVKVIVK